MCVARAVAHLWKTLARGLAKPSRRRRLATLKGVARFFLGARDRQRARQMILMVFFRPFTNTPSVLQGSTNSPIPFSLPKHSNPRTHARARATHTRTRAAAGRGRRAVVRAKAPPPLPRLIQRAAASKAPPHTQPTTSQKVGSCMGAAACHAYCRLIRGGARRARTQRLPRRRRRPLNVLLLERLAGGKRSLTEAERCPAKERQRERDRVSLEGKETPFRAQRALTHAPHPPEGAKSVWGREREKSSGGNLANARACARARLKVCPCKKENKKRTTRATRCTQENKLCLVAPAALVGVCECVCMRAVRARADSTHTHTTHQRPRPERPLANQTRTQIVVDWGKKTTGLSFSFA